jgi:DHA1 family multidrug resistance protein-like MFS transporter
MKTKHSSLDTLILGIAIFVAMLGVGNIVPFLPLYAKSMGANSLMMGLIFSVFAFSRMLVLGHVGGWSDRRGRKSFIIFGLGLMTVASLGMDLASNTWHLVGLRGIMGFASAFVLPIAMALVADYITEGREGRTIGNFNTAILLGLGLGPMIGGWLYDNFGVSACFYIMSGLTLVSFLLVILWVKDSPPELRKTSAQNGWSNQVQLLKDRRMLGVFIARVGTTMAMGNFMTFLPVLCTNHNLGGSHAGTILAVNMLVMTAVQNPAGRLADRFSRVKLSVTALICTGLIKALLPLAAGYHELLFLSFLEGICAGLAMPALSAPGGERGPPP